MNNFTANREGSVNLNASRYIPRPQELSQELGYTYNNFIQDLFYGFMIHGMEYTNEYTLLMSSTLQQEEFQDCLNYGIANGYLWLVEVAGTPVTYMEIANPQVSEDLLYTYVTDFVISQGIAVEHRDDVIAENVSELKEVYNANVLHFISSLQPLVTTPDVLKPFGICGLSDSNIEVLDKQAVPVYRVSFSKFMSIIDHLGIRTLGVWTGGEYRQFVKPSGRADFKLNDIRVTKAMSCLYVKGIHLKRTNIRDYGVSDV